MASFSPPPEFVIAIFSGLGLLVTAVLTWAWKAAHRETQNGEGASSTAVLKAALDENTKAKREEKEAVLQMSHEVRVLVSTLAASNRQAERAFEEAGEVTALLRDIKLSCARNTDQLTQIANVLQFRPRSE